MDQNLARLQNPHRFLRENRFLEGEDPSKTRFYLNNTIDNFFHVQNNGVSKHTCV